MAGLYMQGRTTCQGLDKLITDSYSQKQINEVVDTTERGEAWRNVIMFLPNRYINS